MLRKIMLVLAVVWLLASPAASAPWKFVSMADSRGSDNGVNTTVLTQIVNRVNQEQADLVIFAGDAIDGSSNTAVMQSQFNTWLSIMNTLNCPWYFTPGNHEIMSAGAHDMLRSLVDMPMNGPAGFEETVYSVEHKNARFVALNSNHWGYVHRVQRGWLFNDLASNTKPHIFVFAHEPAYPLGAHVGNSLDAYPAERDEFWDIMSKAGVGMYFCGHVHLYYRAKFGNITQVINGTCGAPFHYGPAGVTQSVYHYVVVTVDDLKVSCLAKDVNGSIIDSWEYSIAPTCDSLRTIADNTQDILLKDKVVTYLTPHAFYVQEDDRSSAMRVSGPMGINTGDRLNVSGRLRTLATGEREIEGSAFKLSGGNTVPRPLGMTTKNILGSPRDFTPGTGDATALNNYGLLVRTFGRVTKVGTEANAGMFYIDDGSGVTDGTVWGGTANAGIRVKSKQAVGAGDYVTTTGVVSVFKNESTNHRMLYVSEDVPVPPPFVAYNDVIWQSGHPALVPNVTTYSVGNGSPGPSSGHLKDFNTGANTGVTVALSQYGGVNWQPDSVNGGSDCNPGTDASNTFGGRVSLMGVIYYGSTAGWWVDASFSGLNPDGLYEFVTTSNRNGGSGYANRFTKYTLSGTLGFTNSSTPGTTIGDSGASTTFSTGHNTVNGYVARWTNIRPAANGTFKVRAQTGSAANEAYAFDAFMLREMP